MPREPSARRRDEGSGTVLVVGAIGVLVVLLVGGLTLVSAAHASTRARTAADLGALAGAMQLVRPDGADPCASAAAVVRANGGALLECRATGQVLDVRASVPAGWPGLGAATARSRAGPQVGEGPALDRPVVAGSPG